MPPILLSAAQGGFSSPGKQVLTAHRATEAVIKPRKFLAVFGVSDDWQIMFQCCAQKLEIFARKNGAGSGWFGHCDIPFINEAFMPLG
jgi:hypothetical protein